ncbi:hypothetical protein GCM10009804_09870 [Kribbella hippodromi]|uniref:Uncharacterized protein n=1 Tax=Kribbella hippodromi TaxID=434347 RepID=A0ABN2C9V4_9ACTN
MHDLPRIAYRALPAARRLPRTAYGPPAAGSAVPPPRGSGQFWGLPLRLSLRTVLWVATV